AEQLHTIHGAVLEGRLPSDERYFNALITAHEKLLDMVDQIAAGQNIQPVPADLQRELDELTAASAAEEDETDSDAQPSVETTPEEPWLGQESLLTEPIAESLSSAHSDEAALEQAYTEEPVSLDEELP